MTENNEKKKMECPKCHIMLYPTILKEFGFMEAEVMVYRCSLCEKVYQRALLEYLKEVNWV